MCDVQCSRMVYSRDCLWGLGIGTFLGGVSIKESPYLDSDRAVAISSVDIAGPLGAAKTLKASHFRVVLTPIISFI